MDFTALGILFLLVLLAEQAEHYINRHKHKADTPQTKTCQNCHLFAIRRRDDSHLKLN